MKFDELMEELDLTEAEGFERRLICDMRPHGALEAYRLSNDRIILNVIGASDHGNEQRVCSVLFERDDENNAIFSRIDGNEKVSGSQILKDLGVQNSQDPRAIIDALIGIFPRKTATTPGARGRR